MKRPKVRPEEKRGDENEGETNNSKTTVCSTNRKRDPIKRRGRLAHLQLRKVVPNSTKRRRTKKSGQKGVRKRSSFSGT